MMNEKSKKVKKWRKKNRNFYRNYIYFIIFNNFLKIFNYYFSHLLFFFNKKLIKKIKTLLIY